MDQTKKEELWNAVSHSIGIILGVIGFVFLLIFDTQKTAYSTLSIVLYASTVIILFSASTIYHAISDIELKTIWRKIDHISIYLLIAGTYTPVSLITLEKGSGWLIFWIVWGIAVMGTILKIFFTGRFEVISLVLYLAMGWLIVFDLKDLVANISADGLGLLMLGGAFYTIGALFYAVKKIPYNHVIWHFFVLGGAVSHYFFILFEVI
ncbi:hemolysin III family protein [Zhouia spongiae]|uniref:Hemolysin III family protein n=1 Tax=Zhouia spongiae TaxID=2202721 RepID=A0ABY3YJ24_9FLAO|nr:hemolysin III family protein [Zhouia spongiae]UNY97506.1 hemolysin III family protein [Zhouia spongiae]